jgi:hypothetical protein
MRLVARTGRFPTGATIVGAGAVAAVAVRLLRLDQLPFPLCTFRAVTGIPCMTCGSTRALGRLAALDLPGAFVMQPLITAIGLLLIVWGLADLALFTLRRRALSLDCTAREALGITWVVLALALANWAYLIAMGR